MLCAKPNHFRHCRSTFQNVMDSCIMRGGQRSFAHAAFFKQFLVTIPQQYKDLTSRANALIPQLLPPQAFAGNRERRAIPKPMLTDSPYIRPGLFLPSRLLPAGGQPRRHSAR